MQHMALGAHGSSSHKRDAGLRVWMLCHRTQRFFAADILCEIWICNCQGHLSEKLESLLLKNIFIKLVPALLLVTYAKDIFLSVYSAC